MPVYTERIADHLNFHMSVKTSYIIQLFIECLVRTVFHMILYFLGMAGYDPCEGRPKLKAWLDLVKSELNPYYDQAHTLVNKISINKSKL